MRLFVASMAKKTNHRIVEKRVGTFILQNKLISSCLRLFNTCPDSELPVNFMYLTFLFDSTSLSLLFVSKL